jgi:hypothetical protein
VNSAQLPIRIDGGQSVVDVKCPHCGHMHMVYLSELTQYAPKVETCDSDAGGCDRMFLVRGRVIATAFVDVGTRLEQFQVSQPQVETITDPARIEALFANDDAGRGG